MTVDSTYLGSLANNAQRIMFCGRVRTHDHWIDSQAPYPIAPHRWTKPREDTKHLASKWTGN